MTRSLSVLYQGDPRLLQRAAKVEGDPDAELQDLIDCLIDLTLAQNGVGIAAPQVGLSQRLMIIASRPNERYPDAPEMSPLALMNPEICDRSEEQVYGWEGCLSVPGQRGWVPRAETIDVAYGDRWGRRRRQRLTGFVARIFQHELDHLDGILFPSRVERPEDLISEVEFLQRVASAPGLSV